MLLLWMAVLVTVVVVFTDPRDVALAVLAAGFWVTWGVREGREMN